MAAIAAQPALVYAYAMQGSIKEITTLWLVPLCVALLVLALGSAPRSLRSGAAPPGGTPRRRCAAAVASIGAGAVVWLGPVLFVGLVRLAIGVRWDVRRIGAWRPRS